MASLQPYTGTLGHRLAAHLLRRCTFQISKSRIDSFATKTATQAVDDLFIPQNLSMGEPIDWQTGSPWVNTGEEPESGNFLLRKHISGWFVQEALLDESIQSKIAFFLHSNFIVNSESSAPRQFFDYLMVLRYFASRSFKELAKKITVENTMLRYLDGTSNTDTNPNENYAREFFELFTIGKGPQIGPGDYTYYTEEDIAEASKLLTGFKQTSRPLGGDPDYFDPEIKAQFGRTQFSQHDTSDKTFSDAFNGQTITGAVDADDMYRELDDFVEMVFAQDETARNICRKLYRFFVNNKISTEVENDIIIPLAQTLKDNDYDIPTALQQLLKSEHFYDQDDDDATDENIGAIVKSPMEILLGTLSFFKIDLPDPLTDSENHYKFWYRRTVWDVILLISGMSMHQPDSVAGYPAYYQEPGYSENWFNGSTLIPRYKMAEILLTGQRVLLNGNNGGVELDIVDFIANDGVVSDPSDAVVLVTELINYLFPETPLPDRFDYFLNEVFLDELSVINWFFEWQHYTDTLDDSSVKIPLERLFTALISSQEFQLM